MTKLLKTLFFVLIVLLAAGCFAQTILPMTTLSAAVATQSTTTVSLTSVTGVVGTSTVLFIADGNGEAMFVNSVNTVAKTVGVTRGYQTLGSAHPHASGSLVFIIQGNLIPYGIKAIPPSGSCVRAQQPALPVISVGAPGVYQSQISDCVGGLWVNGVIVPTSPTVIYYPQSGGAVLTGVGTSTATTNTSMYCSEIDLPMNKLLTGLRVLNGTVTGNGNRLVALYDASGNLIANSATAGALTGTASQYQAFNFTAQYYAVGPARYFGCSQAANSTDTLNLVVTADGNAGLLTQIYTGQTFGTIPATITAPTAYTTAQGPYWGFF